jgi:hypothetical protein
MAASKKPVEQGAQFVYDKLPDEIVELMALDNWFELLAEVAPDCTLHKDWLQQVRDKALAMFDEGEEEKSA